MRFSDFNTIRAPIRNSHLVKRISFGVIVLVLNGVLSRRVPVRPRSTHPPVGNPFRSGRCGDWRRATPALSFLYHTKSDAIGPMRRDGTIGRAVIN